MIPDDELEKGQKRLLDTDASVVVPVNTTVRVQVTAADVLHAWAVPASGVKIDVLVAAQRKAALRDAALDEGHKIARLKRTAD